MSMLESDYQWDFSLTTEDAKQGICSRYIFYSSGEKHTVGEIFKHPSGDYMAKLYGQNIALPFPFTNQKLAERYVEAYFRFSPKERTG